MSCPRSSSCIVYYHGNDWDGVPARQRYLMEEMARYCDVLFIDGTGGGRLRVEPPKHVAEGVTLFRGIAPNIARLRRRRMDRAASLFARFHLGVYLRRYRRVCFWNAENWLRPYEVIPHDLLVFDSIDPAFTEDTDELLAFDARERKVATEADLVFASAESLLEYCRRFNPNTYLLPNACAPGEYTLELIASASRPSWWPRTAAPIALFLGTLDFRVDYDLLEAVCRRSPDVFFVIAGTITQGSSAAVARLASLPNVVTPGRVSVSDGRYALGHCDVGLIPFKVNPMNDGVNPVKMYVYACLGKPLIGTPTRELVRERAVVNLGETSDAFASAITAAILDSRNPARQSELIEFASKNTWAIRAREAWKHLEPNLQIGRLVPNPSELTAFTR